MYGNLTATVRHHFSAGHRIPGLPGAGEKCTNVHGHTFGVSWTVGVPSLDATVVEFGELKRAFRGWIDQRLDHGFIVGKDDLEMLGVLKLMGSKHFVTDNPPTTEAIASVIAQASQDLLSGVVLLSVEVTEGPHNAATWHNPAKVWSAQELEGMAGF
ncbi:QueD-like queosine biosynthesis protein [Mycobacterium phage Typha]|uniref:QueD-like queosine biosynthesis protein n=1 Tax=Mycobacterium phage Typha TaxID=2517971 RepID=A0A482JDI5_9CAUD|nr:QueD-like 6-pyruvoyl-tetrahydropterin synthase [Mycobacterium phage Typha]QBP29662.1 QueD-like queosine biosynthesis protein [Mycobacterium phage Typha]URM86449.1 QueD-like preQ0 pathway protein [Mycobacterium phage Hilltopfarm]